jgi:hypothetical protein
MIIWEMPESYEFLSLSVIKLVFFQKWKLNSKL